MKRKLRRLRFLLGLDTESDRIAEYEEMMLSKLKRDSVRAWESLKEEIYRYEDSKK